MKLHNSAKVFNIILPGPCNANCSFCYWKEEKECDNYIEKLKKILINLPPKFDTVALTGGEPLLSLYLEDVLKLLRPEKNNENLFGSLQQFEDIVLTTNGTMMDKINFVSDYITHLNISRHGIFDNEYTEIINSSIYNIKQTIPELNKKGINTNFNCILYKNEYNTHWIIEYINLAKSKNISTISFRNIYNDQKKFDEIISLFDDYKNIEHYKTNGYEAFVKIINGMKVYFKNSFDVTEETDTIYELFFFPSGKLYLDRQRKFKVTEDNLKKLGNISLFDSIEKLPKENNIFNPNQLYNSSVGDLRHQLINCNAPISN